MRRKPRRKAAAAPVSRGHRIAEKIAEKMESAFWVSSWPRDAAVYVSSEYRNIWGQPVESLYKQPNSWMKALHPEDRRRVSRSLRDRETKACGAICRIFRPDGTIRWISIRMIPIKNSSDQAFLMAAFAEDITEVKAAEEARQAIPGWIMEAQESERRHLARELHDGVIQILIGAQYRLQAGLDKLEARGGPAYRHLSSLGPSLSRVIQEIRSVCKNLLPMELEDMGLLPALRELFDEFRDRTGLAVAFRCCGGAIDRVTRRHSLAVFRVAQEALSNVQKHARAKRVDVLLDVQGGNLRLIIDDDGRGPRKRGGKMGLGLKSMNERAAALKGTAGFGESPRRGVRVTFSIPLDEAGR